MTVESRYEAAKARLHVACVPDSLPCREGESAQIYELLHGAIAEAAGSCVYISGTPGTGKTATVKEVIRALHVSAQDGTLREFDALEINGMRVTEPAQAYVELWRKVSGGQNVTARHALALLEAHFSRSADQMADAPPLVVLMDELDLLVTRKQTVMYNFFEWPNRPCSRLIVVAIANTMDLPERMLSNKVSSRLGLQRINFAPYTLEQLKAIVNFRLQGLDVFGPSAVEFVARKVITVTGDARRCLDICRRAVELAERDHAALAASEGRRAELVQVSIAHVQRIVSTLNVSPGSRAVAAASKVEKLFLTAVIKAVEKKGIGEAILGDVIDEHVVLSRKAHVHVPSVAELGSVCNRLFAMRFIQVERGAGDILRRVKLNLNEDDFNSVLRNDDLTKPFFT